VFFGTVNLKNHRRLGKIRKLIIKSLVFSAAFGGNEDRKTIIEVGENYDIQEVMGSPPPSP
jgi:hypothetical protein